MPRRQVSRKGPSRTEGPQRIEPSRKLSTSDETLRALIRSIKQSADLAEKMLDDVLDDYSENENKQA